MTFQRMTALMLTMLVMMAFVGCSAGGNGDEAATATTTAPVTTTTAEPITAKTQIGKVEASTYIVRTGPGLDYESVGGLQENDEIVIVDREGDWYKIEFGDGFGYINSQYVTIIGQTTYTTKPTTTTTTTTTTVTKAPTVTDEHGNVVTTTATTGKNGETAPTQNGTTVVGQTTATQPQTDNTDIEFEKIPGVVVEDNWD